MRRPHAKHAVELRLAGEHLAVQADAVQPRRQACQQPPGEAPAANHVAGGPVSARFVAHVAPLVGQAQPAQRALTAPLLPLEQRVRQPARQPLEARADEAQRRRVRRAVAAHRRRHVELAQRRQQRHAPEAAAPKLPLCARGATVSSTTKLA